MTDLKRRLARSYAAFFGRFERLTPVQREALPHLLDGYDVLITAPTASGKTEAFAAPAAEMILAGRRGGARAVFVSPTRALANDLKRRLEGRYAELDVSLGRYTGDHKERVNGQLPEVSITTPEGLDSLLARRAGVLASVRLVVCDEIHVLDGTPRGDQLRVLLHRLEQVADNRPQRVAASATIGAPDETAARYLREARVVVVAGARQIRAKMFHGRSPAAMAEHLHFLSKQGFRKVLVFCNRRKDVEDLSAKLKGRCVFESAVFPHHGSLSRQVRERTERRFLDAPAAVAFATMTLELGIDIGTVDYVLLASPPPDVSSLLQRIGRGGRRTASSRAGYVTETLGDELIFRVLFASGVQGRLLDDPYSVRPGILVQQALVVAGGEGWIDAGRLRESVPQAVWREVAPTGPAEVLRALVDAEILEASQGGRFVLAETTEKRYDVGTLHSNIDSESVDEIVDRLTGEVIGHMAPSDERRLNLGGRGRKVVGRRRGRVLTDETKPTTETRFSPRSRPSCSFAQGRAVVEALGCARDEIAQIQSATATLLLHGLGTVGSLLLVKLLGAELGEGVVVDSSPYVLRLNRPLGALPRPHEDRVQAFVRSHQRELARIVGMGPWHEHLPTDLRIASVTSAAALNEIVSFLVSARLVQLPEDEPHAGAAASL